ncbi:hypothetical protein Tco_0251721 [Tanacetum coccineum]
MRMAITNNIKSTLPGIENQNAKDFLKLLEEKFRSADKALVRTLMAELTTMKLDGLKSMWQHVLDMTITAERLKILSMNMDDSFLVKDGHFQKDCPKRKAWFEKKGVYGVLVEDLEGMDEDLLMRWLRNEEKNDLWDALRVKIHPLFIG